TLHTNIGWLNQTSYPNRTMWDTDGDGLSDGSEIIGWTIDIKYPDNVINRSFVSRFYASDPCINDSDGDGLYDGIEYLFSNPWTNDTDEDGWDDIIEDGNGNGLVDAGETSPRNADTDGDTLPDGWVWTDWGQGEFQWGEDRNRNNETDGGTETHPLNPDTDGDMISDGAEFAISITLNFTGGGFGDHDLDGIIDILDTDSDNDGLTDWEENCDQYHRIYDDSNGSYETNPLDNDTDDDGLLDGAEPGRQSDADNDGKTNGHDNNSNSYDQSGLNDYAETFVLFRTNASLVSSSKIHSYNVIGVWISVDTNVSIWQHSKSGVAYNLDLSWSNAGYLYDDYSNTKPDDTENVVIHRVYISGSPTEPVNLATPEGYPVLVQTTTGDIVIEVPEDGDLVYY
ncbi:MAG: hypothetical protein KAX80_15790, partial [Planctomycetes bacterium]|nr:hypothetical protein [Planctomycetota bacterium]